LVSLDLEAGQAVVIMTREDPAEAETETGAGADQFSGALGDLTGAAAFVDGLGRFQDVSADLAALWGSAPEALAGRTCAEIFPGALGRRLEEIRFRAMTLGLDQTEKIDLVEEGNRRRLEVTFNVVWVQNVISGLYFSCQNFREEPAGGDGEALSQLQAEEEMEVSALKKAQLLVADDYNYRAAMNRALSFLGHATQVDRVQVWQIHPGATKDDDRLLFSRVLYWNRLQASADDRISGKILEVR
jgi:hypothetical protein